jgi:diacylglycerol kinase family enzyme
MGPVKGKEQGMSLPTKQIHVVINPAAGKDVWIDGDSDGQTPVITTAIPQALEIVVPG